MKKVRIILTLEHQDYLEFELAQLVERMLNQIGGIHNTEIQEVEQIELPTNN